MRGRWITASVGVALIYAGAHVALTAPPLSGVPLIGTPLLFLVGASLIVRLMRTTTPRRSSATRMRHSMRSNSVVPNESY